MQLSTPNWFCSHSRCFHFFVLCFVLIFLSAFGIRRISIDDHLKMYNNKNSNEIMSSSFVYNNLSCLVRGILYIQLNAYISLYRLFVVLMCRRSKFLVTQPRIERRQIEKEKTKTISDNRISTDRSAEALGTCEYGKIKSKGTEILKNLI